MKGERAINFEVERKGGWSSGGKAQEAGKRQVEEGWMWPPVRNINNLHGMATGLKESDLVI